MEAFRVVWRTWSVLWKNIHKHKQKTELTAGDDLHRVDKKVSQRFLTILLKVNKFSSNLAHKLAINASQCGIKIINFS